MTVLRISSEPEPGKNVEIGLAAAVAATDEDIPYLRRAVENIEPAHATKVEWLVDGPEKRPVSWFNWTQIVRTPFGVSNVACASQVYGGDIWARTKAEMLARHLTDVETTIRDGHLFRQISYHLDEETGEWYPLETRGMGGVKFFLRRAPVSDDYISLRVLRDCVFLDRTGAAYDGRLGEFLSEISLVVRPAVLAVSA